MINYTIPQISSMPSQFYEGSTDEQQREWYRNWALWIASGYNRPNPTLSATIPGYGTPTSSASTQLGIATKMYRNYSYMLGIQENMNYKFAIDDKGQQIGTNMIPGQTITRLVRHLQGKFTDLVNSLDITVKATSNEAMKRKNFTKEALEMKFDQKAQFDQLAQSGVTFEPKGSNKVHTKEDIYDYVENEQEECELWANDIAQDCWMRNHMEEKCVLAGGLQVPVLATSAFHVYVENGVIKIDLPDPTRLVWDPGTGFDTLNRNMRYAGIFNGQLTPAQVVSLYGDQIVANYGEAELLKIKSVTYDTYQNAWPNVDFSGGTFDWLTVANKTVTISTFRAYWIADEKLIEEDVPYYVPSPNVNQYGYRPFIKLKDAEKAKAAGVTVYQADIIGGMYCVNCGPMKNVVHDEYSPANPTIPLFVYNSSVIMGEITSIVDMLIQTQDRLDYINNTITNLIAINMGKVFVFRRSQIGDSKMSELFNDLRTMGATIVEDATGEEIDKMVSLGQAVDLSKSEEISYMINLREAESASMEKMIGISSIAMGAQEGYISKGVQNRTLDVNAASTQYMYTGFVSHVERVLQYSTNVGKMMYSGSESLKMMGKDGPKYLQENKDMSLEDFGVYLRVSDAISAGLRESIVQFSLMLVQAGRLSELDMLEIYSAKTISRLKAYFRRAIKQREIKEQEAEGLRAAEAFAMQQANNEAQLAMNNERVQAGAATNAQNNEVKIASELIRADSKQGQPVAQ